MKVKIQYLGLTKNLTKQSEEQLELKEGASLSQLLNKLAGIHGAPFAGKSTNLTLKMLRRVL